MKSDVVSIEKVIPVATLPNGEYKGTWGGYEAKVTINDIEYRIRTTLGIRTISAPCFIHVRDGLITIEVDRVTDRVKTITETDQHLEDGVYHIEHIDADHVRLTKKQ